VDSLAQKYSTGTAFPGISKSATKSVSSGTTLVTNKLGSTVSGFTTTVKNGISTVQNIAGHGIRYLWSTSPQQAQPSPVTADGGHKRQETFFSIIKKPKIM
jgi:hypothetical protein